MLWKLMLITILALPLPAWAWGAEGHEIVAEIALQELTPAARARIAAILGSDAMLVHVSNWADEIRDQRPETGSWHFVDIPLQAPGYDVARDCAGDNCVVAQITNTRAILAAPSSSSGAKQAALRFLIHLVADVHQPLHAEDNQDRGGNAVHVSERGTRTNLHHVWDTEVVAALGNNVDAIATALERDTTPAERKAWAGGTPADWANESHAIARDVIYPRFHDRTMVRLPSDYDQEAAPITRQQLTKAGVRLAWLLNITLK
jgi:hypothetical protein